jgi:hypothetical protein
MRKHKQIYIVTMGEYSDYQIVGVFDKEELAEEYKGDDNWARIEEYDLNPQRLKIAPGKAAYRVWMRRDGDTKDVREREDGIDTTDIRFGEPDDHGLYACVLAKSPQHAVKIVNEHRVQLIANGEWPEKVNDPIH